MFDKLKSRARALKNEVHAVYLASKDPRTPWYAKAMVFLVVAYIFSPIDLIPDFIPVLGYLDDLVIVPLGVALAIRMIPPDVLDKARRNANQGEGPGRGVRVVGIILIALAWILILIVSYRFVISLLG